MNTQRTRKLLQSALQTGKHLWHLSQTSPVPREFFRAYLAFILFILCVSVGLFFLVEQRIERYKLGYKLEQLKNEKQRLEEKLHVLRAENAKLKSPSSLLQSNQAMALYLLPPSQWTSN